MVCPLNEGETRITCIEISSFSLKYFQDGMFKFNSSKPNEKLSEICKRQGIELYDPTSQFKDIIKKEGIFRKVWPHPKDTHFSAIGHEILSSLLDDYLQTEIIPQLSK